MADDRKALDFDETGVAGTAAELFASAARIGLRVAMLPFATMKDLPFGLGDGVARTSASFPRAMARALDGLAQELEGVGENTAPADLDKPGVHPFRNHRQNAAIVFVHGFGQSSRNTWGRFVDILAEDERVNGWDIFLVGYSTNITMDVAGLWAASPPLDRLALFFQTVTSSPPLDRYKSLAIVAHSMGGLVAQRSLIDSPELRSRVTHAIFYGTPSGGLKKAGLLTRWKRQIRDMAKDSSFIVDLRQRWQQVMTSEPPFALRAVAGDRDEFVPSWSSLEPFSDRFQSIVPGDHLTLVGPTSRDYEIFKQGQGMHLSVRVLVKHLMGEADPTGPLNSARLAVEKSDFRAVIDRFEDQVADLDDEALVMLALAYDATGQQDRALEILEQRGEKSTDLMGVLAGRIKRRWLLARSKHDADRAARLYSGALARAEEAADHAQVYYHAINVAFLALAAGEDRAKARELAVKALEHTARAEDSVWKSATEGEANLYLGNNDDAIRGYREALTANPPPRQITSMFQQAVRVAELLDDEPMADRLRSLFRDHQG